MADPDIAPFLTLDDPTLTKEVLPRLPDEFLGRICRANLRLAGLCNDPLLWQIKLDLKFPGYRQGLSPGTDPRNYYILLRGLDMQFPGYMVLLPLGVNPQNYIHLLQSVHQRFPGYLALRPAYIDPLTYLNFLNGSRLIPVYQDKFDQQITNVPYNPTNYMLTIHLIRDPLVGVPQGKRMLNILLINDDHAGVILAKYYPTGLEAIQGSSLSLDSVTAVLYGYRNLTAADVEEMNRID